jgi:CheY-like chemotaxis protein
MRHTKWQNGEKIPQDYLMVNGSMIIILSISIGNCSQSACNQISEKNPILKYIYTIQKIVPQSYLSHNAVTPGNGSKTILIGEDDLDDQEFLKEIFSSIGEAFTYEFVFNGGKLLEYLEKAEHLPCLIVLDYNMPELNGAEILAQLKKNDRYNSIPKIIWSTSNSTTFKEKCLELGANDYVVKPSNVSDLKDIARYMLSFCNG